MHRSMNAATAVIGLTDVPEVARLQEYMRNEQPRNAGAHYSTQCIIYGVASFAEMYST